MKNKIRIPVGTTILDGTLIENDLPLPEGRSNREYLVERLLLPVGTTLESRTIIPEGTLTTSNLLIRRYVANGLMSGSLRIPAGGRFPVTVVLDEPIEVDEPTELSTQKYASTSSSRTVEVRSRMNTFIFGLLLGIGSILTIWFCATLFRSYDRELWVSGFFIASGITSIGLSFFTPKRIDWVCYLGIPAVLIGVGILTFTIFIPATNGMILGILAVMCLIIGISYFWYITRGGN